MLYEKKKKLVVCRLGVTWKDGEFNERVRGGAGRRSLVTRLEVAGDTVETVRRMVIVETIGRIFDKVRTG